MTAPPITLDWRQVGGHLCAVNSEIRAPCPCGLFMSGDVYFGRWNCDGKTICEDIKFFKRFLTLPAAVGTLKIISRAAICTSYIQICFFVCAQYSSYHSE